MRTREEVGKGTQPNFHVSTDGVLKFHNRVCIPYDAKLKKVILLEAHQSLYAVHPSGTKMYRDLRKNYWWNGMKKDSLIHGTMSHMSISQGRPLETYGGVLATST